MEGQVQKIMTVELLPFVFLNFDEINLGVLEITGKLSVK